MQKTNTTTTHTDARGRRLSPLVPRPRALEARPLLKVQKGTALILRAVFAALSPRPSRTTVANRAGGHLNSAMRYSIRPPVVIVILLPLLTPSSLEARPLPKVQKEPGATLEVGRRLLRPLSARPAVENGASGHQGRPFIAAAPPASAARPPGPPPPHQRHSPAQAGAATVRQDLTPPSRRLSEKRDGVVPSGHVEVTPTSLVGNFCVTSADRKGTAAVPGCHTRSDTKGTPK